MTYPSDKWTDSELESLEKRIAEVFREASEDLDKEVKEYFAKFVLRDKEMQKLANAGEITQAELQQWRLTQMGRGQRFEALRDKVAERYTQANLVANQYVNDATPSLYSLNRNYEAYTIEKAVGCCDFTLWDEATVRKLLVEQPDLMPYYPPSRALNRGIDLAYGKSQITKHVTSGIIRGLPPGKIANELMANMESMNRESAVRAARTGITAAQNAGRMDSYVAAEKMGITIRRKWICTKDARTRLSHGMADGQIVEGTKKPFIVGGYKMMFPGDKSLNAPGHEIYNCRCTTRTVEKDGIEAEPRQMRVKNPLWEEAKAEETALEKKLEKLKEREQAETDPVKRKQLRQERIAAQKELTEATKKRQGLDKNVVVPEMNYSEWKNWKQSLVKTGTGGTMTGGSSAKVDVSDIRSKLKAINTDYKDIEAQMRLKRRSRYYAHSADEKDRIDKEIGDLNKQLEELKKKRLEQGKLLVENMNTSFKVSGDNEKFVSLIVDLDSKIDYKEVFKHTSQISDIINAVGGGDLTVGSCASVGLAYTGQKHGLSVLDFRDGPSRDWFSGKSEKLRIWDSLGIKYITEDSAKSSITNGKRILAQMEVGKEYYLSVGRHATLVRAVDGMVKSPRTGKEKPGKIFQYLELQSSKNNGWQNFDGNPGYTLQTRFGCSSSSNYYATAYLTDIDQVADNDEFRTILGYINTDESEQRKGKYGTIK